MLNLLSKCIIEFHIIQSFPVSTLNRDDTGSPKTAVVGGVLRARVSSQAWKRQVRLALNDFGIKLAHRTKKIDKLFEKAILEIGADEENAADLAAKFCSKLGKDTLIFLGDQEIFALAETFKAANFDVSNVKDKDIKAAVKNIDPSLDALDIALFGRMVAKLDSLDIEAATSFNHAISTHKIDNDFDFFSALDDFDTEKPTAHIGHNEFNSATYYRYVSLNLGVLAETLFGDQEIDLEMMKQAVEVFTKALFIAVPFARQNTQAAYSPWDYAKVLVRKGQNLQLSFDKPVSLNRNNNDSGMSELSILRLQSDLTLKESVAGSLFGKIADFDIGQEPSFNVDNLVDGLVKAIGEING